MQIISEITENKTALHKKIKEQFANNARKKVNDEDPNLSYKLYKYSKTKIDIIYKF